MVASAKTSWPALQAFWPSTRSITGHDKRLGFLASFGQASFQNFTIESVFAFGGHAFQTLRFSVDDEVGDFVQPSRFRSEWFEGRVSKGALFMRHAA